MKLAQAAEVAERYAATIRYSRAAFEKARPRVVPAFFRWHELSAIGGHKPPPDLDEITQQINAMPPDLAANIVMSGQDVGALALWNRHKTVLLIDPELWQDLGDLDDATMIPKDLFQQLPYPDPFIVFPEPMRLPMDDGFMLIGGFFLSGRQRITDAGPHRAGVQCSTHEEGANGVGLLFGGEIFHPNGRRYLLADGRGDMLWTRVSVADGHTLGEMIEASASSFVSIALDTSQWRYQLPLMTRRAMSCLMYLCATNADLRPVIISGGRPTRRGGRTVKAAPARTVVEVGYRLGAALRRWRIERDHASEQLGSGHHKRPHVRRSHPHTYWTGPGRTIPQVKWLAPIEVNFDRDADQPTIHKVG